ncbi:putative peptide ABC transporter permease protein [Gordonia paraffinivorans NBRC 108238]|uniref:Peptide ABC transporter permease protein n=1 Tax=Gordonia paraffinivorans NBRC 108238 TaxID=1223543 RepID=A0ABQ0INQ2_9ACTN|nr:ABC transporter permease [Gordonia paraffinivorans]MCD2145952.1 ABC transporter permease [Gordonia paraffinivorans]GAC85135.1 putative peptide ABC transporter permease protein [Gordonia paraffinivorans NBRC 108238]
MTVDIRVDTGIADPTLVTGTADGGTGTKGFGAQSVLSRLSEWAWVGRAAGRAIVNFLIFVVAAFFLVQLIPGDPLVSSSGGRLSGEALEKAREVYELNGSLASQFWSYLTSLFSFDLGESIATGRPVAEDMATRIPATLELIGTGLFFACLVALPMSYFVVTKPTNRFAKVLRSYASSAGAIPEYVVGILFLFVFFATLAWVPAPSGRLDPTLMPPAEVTGFPILDAFIAGDAEAANSYISHLILPVAVMVVSHTAILVKSLILALDTEIDNPATRFRIASGAPRRIVIASVYRRALPSAVAMLGMIFGLLLGGAVVLESLFGLGGLGQYAVDAVRASDVFALRSFLVVIAGLCLIVYFLTEVATGLLDSRRRDSRNQEV